MTSTSTEFLLLVQKVELLQYYSSWIIAGVTLTITVLIALFLAIQFSSFKKFAEDRIISLKSEFGLLFQTHKNELKTISDKFQKTELQLNSQHGQAMTYSAERTQDYEIAFMWKTWELFFYFMGEHEENDTHVADDIDKLEEFISKSGSQKWNFKGDRATKEMIIKMLNVLKPVNIGKVDNIIKDFKSKINN